jgi:uncharacterized protein (DUF4415 family)
MSTSKILTDERIAEILAFEDTDISDCPELSDEELAQFTPKHPEYFKPIKKAVQIRLDADVLAWFKTSGKGYQTRINAILRQAMAQQRMRTQ